MVIKNTDDSFESYEEFIDYLSRGGELEFRYKDKDYCIIPLDKGFYISEAYNEITAIIYELAEQVGKYKLEGESLRNLVTKIEVTMRLF